ncbi:MAG: DUF6056 family protein [Ignavibacteria bacterium]
MILTLLPFLFLFYFNHPSADDFGMAENTKLFGFFNAQKFYYTGWTGKYFSNAVNSFNPLYFNSITGYKIMTFLLMVIFFYILYLLIREFTLSKLSFKERLIFSLSVFFLYLYSMPSVAHSFYWFTAAAVYQLGIILILLFLLSYIRIDRTGSSLKKNLYVVMSFLLIVCITGCSEIAMAMLCLILLTIVAANLTKHKKINRLLIAYIIIYAVSAYFVVSAPGNKVREQMFPENHQLVNSIIITFSVLIKSTVQWIFNSPLVPVTILLIPVLLKISDSIKGDGKRFFLNPFFTFPVLFVFLFGLIFLPVWSIGKEPYSRTLNVIYFTFLAGWFYNILTLTLYITKKYGISLSRIPKYIYIIAFAVVCLLLVKKNNVRIAYADLLRGTAYKYNNELYQRYDSIIQSRSENCEVTEIENIPRTLYVSDLSSDPEEEFNKKYAHYFNKKSIILKTTVKKSEDK